MPGKKTKKQRRKELQRNKVMAANRNLTKLDMVRIGKSTDKGQKW